MGSKKKKNIASDTNSDSGSQSLLLSTHSDDSSQSSQRRRRRKRREREGRKDRHSGITKSHGRKKERREIERREKRRKKSSRDDDRRTRRKRKKIYRSDSELDGSSTEEEKIRDDPESVVREMLAEFPNVAVDLKQLLQMIDEGQAVDIKGISERSLVKHLKKLFLSLNLDENGGIFLLPANRSAVLTSVGPLIEAHMQHHGPTLVHDSAKDLHSSGDNAESGRPQQEYPSIGPKDDAPTQKRIIGPAMPSAELLAAAAKLTEAQAELREAELEEDDEVFIGPAPPAVVAEAESANEAERFEEVTRIMGAEADDPYDVIGVNHRMSTDQIKKRYWKLSLLVHPDKCSHPQAHQSFIKLNKAFKELQDPDKRKALDDKIKLKEEQESFMVELKAMREAAQWRKLQGISMEGDDELLAEINPKVTPTRDEWMTKLPPERKPGVTMQSTKFSKTSREGRGDTSVWTDTPSDRAQKAKMNYLEAYNEAAALTSNDEKKKMNADADMVDMYNKEKRSKSLVQKYQEDSSSRSKKKSNQRQQKGDWVGKHPWKPWDREKDLVAGRQSVNFDTENMAQGLTSRFSSGAFQRNFL